MHIPKNKIFSKKQINNKGGSKLMKSTKQIVSMMLAASMMFTTVCASAVNAEELEAVESIEAVEAVEADVVETVDEEPVEEYADDEVVAMADMSEGTYSFEATSLSGADKEDIVGSLDPEGYFTVIGTVQKRVAGSSDPSINAIQLNSAQMASAIQFTTTGAGTVTFKFASTGGTNQSYAAVVDASDNILASDETTGTIKQAKDLTCTLPGAGTYRIGGMPGFDARGCRIYSINVTVTGGTAPVETTTVAPTEATTENPTEATTEAPTEATTANQGEAVKATIMASAVNAAFPDGLVDGSDLGSGISVVNGGSAFAKKTNSFAYTDGFANDEQFQVGNGNTSFTANTVGAAVTADMIIEKALKVSAGGAGTVTVYAGLGSSGVTTAPVVLTDGATILEVQNIVNSGDDKNKVFNPITFNVPAAGTYYIIQPGKVTSLNVTAILVDLEGGVAPTEATTDVSTETTTEATTVASTETTTEASTETTTEAPTYAADTLLLQPVINGVDVMADGKQYIDPSQVGQKVRVDFKLSQNNTIGFNSYTMFATYDPTVLKAVSGYQPKNADDLADFITYPSVDQFGAPIDVMCYTVQGLTNQINLVPDVNDSDYADVNADGVKSAADFGKLKLSWYCEVKDSDSNLISVKGDGILFSMEFEVVGTGAANLDTKFISGGFKPSPVDSSAGKTLTAVGIPGVAHVETAPETTTETTTATETTTEETTLTEETTVTEDTTVTEETTVTETTTVTEATTEVTTATEVSTETTTDTETTTEKDTETTTKRRSSGGGGGGGSSSGVASGQKTTEKDTEETTRRTTERPTEVATIAGPEVVVQGPNGEVVIAPPVNNVNANVNFADISTRPWAVDSINKLAKLGVVNGVSDSAFAPDAYSKRADFVVMLSKTLGLSGYATENFSDVAGSKYYYNAVGLAYEAGIVNGYGDGTFGPEKNLTREEMMVLVAQTLKFLGVDTTTNLSVLDQFADKDSVSSWAASSVAYLVSAGIVSGTGNNIEPGVAITRAQMAVMMSNVYDTVLAWAKDNAVEDTTVEDTTEETSEEATDEETTDEEDAETTTVEGETETTTEAE